MTVGSRQSFWTSSTLKLPEIGYAFYKNNYAYSNVGSPNGKSALSFGGWFKLLQPCNEGMYIACGWNQSGGWGSTYIIKNSWDQSVSIRFGSGSSSTFFGFVAENIVINKWVHCIASYDGQKIQFFGNGLLGFEQNTGPINMINNDSLFRIATVDEGSQKYSSVAAAQVFILNRGIITETEAQSLMTVKGFSNIVTDSALVEAWRIDELQNNSFVGLKGVFSLNVSSTTSQVDGPERERVIELLSLIHNQNDSLCSWKEAA